jgi:plasmid stabilization system protein ParE
LKQAYITELAESDLAKIWAYIAQHSPAAAGVFIEKLRAQCHELAASPELGRKRPEFAEGLYSYRVRNYFIADNGIEVARVLHGARDLPRLF